jgi:glycosyltransferase involved in cell wall biosynthesis
MPKVSVIIPCYNAMPYLSETVDSVLRQTYTNFEIIIIDDGSSDKTVEWASQLTDPRIKLISQENKGAAGARNTGIANSQGEYIAFLDADDLWEPTKLEKQVQCLDKNSSVGLVHTWIAFVDAHGKPTGKIMTTDGEGNIWKQVAEYNPVRCGSTSMIRRCCFETVGLFDQSLRFVEDWDMWIRIASRYTFGLVKEPLVCYREHPNNKSKNYEKLLQSLCQIIEKSFQSVSPELLYIQKRAYGRAYLHAAWRAFYAHNYPRASELRQQAIAYYPQLRYLKNCIRLGLLLLINRWFSSQKSQKMFGYKLW